MIKKIQTIVLLLSGFLIFYSCRYKEPKLYAESFSVIHSSSAGNYFYSDEGFVLYPAEFDPKWGKDGDRVLVGFYYNPTITSSTISITVEKVTPIPTHTSALPASVDTVGTGKFVHDESKYYTTYARAAQNFLTVSYFLKYNDAAKHSTGFIEEDELYRNDTLFLKIWHNTKESGEESVLNGYMALDLSCYDQYLKYSYADSTIISIKYDVINAGSSEEKTGYLVYYRESPF
ncbi:MAG: hypothetical protein LBT50_04115 [Prevotellaceae bacterium]|nr:hypothetical protein [Prevotellaceae bacterium]